MSDEGKLQRPLARRLTVDLFEDGDWEINMMPHSNGLMKFEVLGILSQIVAQLRTPGPAINPPAADPPAQVIEDDAHAASDSDSISDD